MTIKWFESTTTTKIKVMIDNIMKDKLEAMACWAKYKSYTASNNLPTMVRNEDIA